MAGFSTDKILEALSKLTDTTREKAEYVVVSTFLGRLELLKTDEDIYVIDTKRVERYGDGKIFTIELLRSIYGDIFWLFRRKVAEMLLDSCSVLYIQTHADITILRYFVMPLGDEIKIDITYRKDKEKKDMRILAKIRFLEDKIRVKIVLKADKMDKMDIEAMAKEFPLRFDKRTLLSIARFIRSSIALAIRHPPY